MRPHILLFFLFFLFLLTPLPLGAEVTVPLQVELNQTEEGKKITVCNSGETEIECEGIAQYIRLITTWAIGFAALLSVLVFMYGGWLWMTARGNTGQVKEAHKVISNTLAGLTLALGSYVILYSINPNLVDLRPLTLLNIEKIDLDFSEDISHPGLGPDGLTENNITYDEMLKRAANQFRIDCTLLKAIIIRESSFNPRSVSDKGAVGLMQVLPTTANMTKEQLMDPQTNIVAGTAYLNFLHSNACNGSNKNEGCETPLSMQKIHEDVALGDLNKIQYVLAAYNAGPGRNKYSHWCKDMVDWKCPDRLKETKNYVPIVINIYKQLRDKHWGCSDDDSPTAEEIAELNSRLASGGGLSAEQSGISTGSVGEPNPRNVWTGKFGHSLATITNKRQRRDRSGLVENRVACDYPNENSLTANPAAGLDHIKSESGQLIARENYLTSELVEPLKKLNTELQKIKRERGIDYDVLIRSACRDYEDQEKNARVFSSSVAAGTVATAGNSFHGFGLAIDVNVIKNGRNVTREIEFDSKKQCNYLATHPESLEAFKDVSDAFISAGWVKFSKEVWHFEYGSDGEKCREKCNGMPSVCTGQTSRYDDCKECP